jgi:hypothetical protein
MKLLLIKKTAYEKHPDFKRIDFGKKEWHTFQNIYALFLSKPRCNHQTNKKIET